MGFRRVISVAVAAVVVSGGALVPAVASAPVSVGSQAPALVLPSAAKFKNCTSLNKKYKHGVGKSGARDKVRGHTKKVTNFKRSNSLYAANRSKDRDKDGIACEKR